MGFNSTVAGWEGWGGGLLIEVTVLGLRGKWDMKIIFFCSCLKFYIVKVAYWKIQSKAYYFFYKSYDCFTGMRYITAM